MSAADSMAQAASADLTGQGTILLVEDEEGLRALNARGLASRGYTVLEAGNGVEAIEVLEKQGDVDLVVSDVVMPEMDGPTLLKELRRRNPNVKIIFVSGYAEEAFSKNLPEQEQYEFLAKPFTLKQLVSKVKETHGGLNALRGACRRDQVAAACEPDRLCRKQQSQAAGKIPIRQTTALPEHGNSSASSIFALGPVHRPQIAACAGAGANSSRPTWIGSGRRQPRQSDSKRR